MTLPDYINSLLAQGRVSFNTVEAVKALGISRKALSMRLSRLRKKQALVTFHNDFHVIVSPEYRKVGCLPADNIIPPFMAYVKTPYYVCLLSAAEYHGASHQKPQVFQVMSSKRFSPIQQGSVRIEFLYKRDISEVPTQQFVVPTGYLIVSTPEATAMDLLRYPYRAGGVNHIATVLTELIETIVPKKLLSLASASSETAWVQRLGYLLEYIEPLKEAHFRHTESVRLLKQLLQQKKPAYVSLLRGETRNFPRNKDWKVIINTQVESDI